MSVAALRMRKGADVVPADAAPSRSDDPQNVTEMVTELFRNLEIAKPSKQKAAKALCVSIGMSVLAYVFLATAPWYLMPLAWLLTGTAVTGLAAVAYDCSNHTFTQSQLVNDIIGMLCMVPFCLPFESWRQYNRPERNGLSTSTFWFFSSTWDWIKANFAFSLSKKLILNLVCVYLFVSLFFPLMAYNLGVWGLVKYYLIPWLVYHFWMSTFIKNGSIVGDSLSTVEYPRWVEFLSHNMNLLYASAVQRMPESVASYNVHQVVEDATRAAEELKIDIEKRNFADMFSMEWVHDVEWVTAIFLFSTPVLGVYGVLTTPFHWQTYAVAFLTYASGGLAITTAYHRCFSHRSYDMARPWIIFWTLLATQTFEGSVLQWCEDHRAHHRYTDTDRDPYDITQGFWNAHMGWLLKKRDNRTHTRGDISDLKADWFFRFQDRYYVPLALTIGFFLPMLVCGLGWGDYKGGLLIAGVLSTVITMQCTFFINSLAHWWGDATYTDERTPRDSALVSLVTFGEGYHNFHHEFPYDYRNGVHATAFDPAKWWIWVAEKLGWAWNVKRFDNAAIAKNKLTMKQKHLDAEKSKFDWGLPIEELPVVTWEELMARKEVVADEEPELDGYKVRADTPNFMVIDGLVHDVTAFVNEHPGGRAFVQTYAGRDATRAFSGGVYAHSLAAKNILATLRVARVEGDAPALALHL
eukprot:TRINITY_DN3376_c0_g1_i1.p1 TRINITY_DN3376_c0_g1~~TRINITY_DN3376_c0_g1_i1.p1  ORF type:complete len:706 (+),score=272.03 TRINITY_DN3376_c0_g1_i1:38-2119(+)